MIDTEANEDEGNPNCRIVAADKPSISIAGNDDDDDVASENEQSPRQEEESKDATHAAASAPPKMTQ